MAAETGTVITVVAGSITFVNQWYVTKQIDWKVPVATVILAAGVDIVSKLDEKGGILLSILILLGAVTTKFDGKSVVNTIADIVNKPAKPEQAKT